MLWPRLLRPVKARRLPNGPPGRHHGHRLSLRLGHRRSLQQPHELDWLRTGLHLNKGCYRGQETVSRVHHLGKPPRRLVMLHLDGSEHDLPAAGDPVYLAGDPVVPGEPGEPGKEGKEVEKGKDVDAVRRGRPVGQVTTAVRHHELGPIALALVKRSLPTDAALRVLPAGSSPDRERGQAASQEAIVADATIS